MKVFISSSIFDLIDIRAELYALFKEMGMAPVMSEALNTQFEVFTDKNSIETCLVNLDNSDFVILVLSQRYGGSLSKAGYGDFSATHLEYRRAIEHSKPIYMYVRDRLEADFSIWKNAEEKELVSYGWVGANDVKLFELLSQHTELTKERPNTNWYKTFRDSIELKEIIKNDFKFTAAKKIITKQFSENKFPLLVPKLHIDTDAIYTHSKLIFKVKIRNAGGAPAFNYSPKWIGADSGYFGDSDADADESISIIAPGDETIMTAIYQLGPGHEGTSMELLLSYSNADGFIVTDVFDVRATIQAGASIPVFSGCTLKTRKFELGKPFEVTIEGQL